MLTVHYNNVRGCLSLETHALPRNQTTLDAHSHIKARLHLLLLIVVQILRCTHIFVFFNLQMQF